MWLTLIGVLPFTTNHIRTIRLLTNKFPQFLYMTFRVINVSVILQFKGPIHGTDFQLQQWSAARSWLGLAVCPHTFQAIRPIFLSWIVLWTNYQSVLWTRIRKLRRIIDNYRYGLTSTLELLLLVGQCYFSSVVHFTLMELISIVCIMHTCQTKANYSQGQRQQLVSNCS